MTILFFFILGACLGSFIPCFAERRREGRSQRGRSSCPHCGETISPLYLIPVLGYFLSSGHCRHCGAPIPKTLPLIELLGGLSGALVALSTDPFLHHLLLLAILSVLLLLSLDDYKQQEIHDSDLLIYAALILIDLLLFSGSFLWLDHLIGSVIVALPLFLITRIRPDSLGEGDVIFMAVSGFYLGTRAVCVAFLIGTLSALIIAGVLLLREKATRNTAIPLIPYLAFGVVSVMLSQIVLS